MKPIITILFLLITSLSFSNCSGDKKDKHPPKLSAPAQIETKPPAPNPVNSQAMQPDLHLSGAENTHISGSTVTANHVSGS